MKIYWFKAQAPLRVVALAKHLNVKAEFVKIDMMAGGLRTAEYKSLNPNCKAPALEDGDYKLNEASAIMAYLCIKAGSDMWPAKNPLEQVEVLKWLSWSDCHWGRAVGGPYFEYIVKVDHKIAAPDPENAKSHHADIVRWGTVLNQHLNGKDYVALDRLTVADFQLASMARYWKEAHMPFEDFPNVVRWLDHLNKIPAWANPWPN